MFYLNLSCRFWLVGLILGVVKNLIDIISNITTRRNDPSQTNFALLNLSLKELILELIERIADIVLSIGGSGLTEISEFKKCFSGILSAVAGLYRNWIRFN